MGLANALQGILVNDVKTSAWTVALNALMQLSAQYVLLEDMVSIV